MSDNIFNEKMFDAMLEMASNEVMERELSELPQDTEIEHEFSPEFELKMQKLIRIHNKEQKRNRFSSVIKRSAAIFIIFMAVGFTGVMSIAAVREMVFETIREIGVNYFEFGFKEKEVQLGVLYPTYIPDGFAKTSTYDINNGTRICYINKDGDIIYFDQFPKAEGTAVQIDNEHSVPYEKELNDITVTVYDGTALDYACYIIWEDKVTFYKIMSVYSADELIKMVESITAQQK